MKYEKTIKEILDINAGDLIKWELDDEKIFAIVTRTEENEIYAISIYDNRKILHTNIHEPHTLYFSSFDNISLILKNSEIDNKFDLERLIE